MPVVCSPSAAAPARPRASARWVAAALAVVTLCCAPCGAQEIPRGFLPDILRDQPLQACVSGGQIRLRALPLLSATPKLALMAGTISFSNAAPGRSERISLSLGERPSIDYELTESGVSLRVRIDEQTANLSLSRQDATDGEVGCWFEQDADGLTLRVEDQDVAARVQAPDVWELWLAAPDLCRERLAPILDVLRGNWGLPAQAAEVRAELTAYAQLAPVEETAAWERWIADLASPSFAVRQAADRALRRLGPQAIPFLQQLPKSALDAEQNYRVRKILEQWLSPESEDTVANVVGSLIGRRSVWLTLLSDADVAVRQAAWERLRRLWPTAGEFDPTAAEELRAVQLEALRAASQAEPAAE